MAMYFVFIVKFIVFIVVLLTKVQLQPVNLAVKSCQCIYLTGTNDKDWGFFNVDSLDVNGTNSRDCMMLFIIGTVQEIIELRLDIIKLRPGCMNRLRIYPHLKDAIVTETSDYDKEICSNNATEFIYDNNVLIHKTQLNAEDILLKSGENYNLHSDALNDNEISSDIKRSIFSSNRAMAVQILFKLPDKNSSRSTTRDFHIKGRFQFVNKAKYQIEGQLIPSTFCDYQFLPYQQQIQSTIENNHSEKNLWRHFYSPRYPAKYPSHIKCLYKFFGRPKNLVDVIFESIYLDEQANKSCIQHDNKITVYDNKLPNKTTIIDVFCSQKFYKRVTSTGANLVIEFDSSSNKTYHGFSGKYRFININNTDSQTYSQLDNSAIKNEIFQILLPNKNENYSEDVFLTNGKSIADLIFEENQHTFGILNGATLNVTTNITNVTNGEDGDNVINRIRACPPGI